VESVSRRTLPHVAIAREHGERLRLTDAANPSSRERLKKPPAAIPGVFRLAHAASRLGLPVSVLAYLRKNGHFEVRHAAVWSSAYSLEDVVHFEGRVAELPCDASKDVAGIQVSTLLNRQLRGDGKGVLIAAILDGKIGVLHRTGPLLRDLVVDSTQAHELERALKRAAHGGTLSCADAGSILGLNPTGVASLCERGLIRSYRCVSGFRVYPGAAEEFKEKFVGLKEVAEAAGSGPIWTVVAAEEAGVEVLRDERRPSRHVFIRRADMAAVVDQVKRTPRGVKKPKGSGSMWAKRRLKSAATS